MPTVVSEREEVSGNLHGLVFSLLGVVSRGMPCSGCVLAFVGVMFFLLEAGGTSWDRALEALFVRCTRVGASTGRWLAVVAVFRRLAIISVLFTIYQGV